MSYLGTGNNVPFVQTPGERRSHQLKVDSQKGDRAASRMFYRRDAEDAQKGKRDPCLRQAGFAALPSQNHSGQALRRNRSGQAGWRRCLAQL